MLGELKYFKQKRSSLHLKLKIIIQSENFFILIPETQFNGGNGPFQVTTVIMVPATTQTLGAQWKVNLTFHCKTMAHVIS